MRMFKVLFLVAFLSGCGGTALVEPRAFDLGLNAPGTSLPPVRLGMVRAVAPFDSIDMHYRLAFRNPAEIAAFANSRWAASPAEMMRKQLLRAGSDKSGRCVMDVEIQEFTQVFAAKESSDARIELRASLSLPGRNFSKIVAVSEANAGPDAPSGTGAFARAADRAIGELAGWVRSITDCN